MGAMAEGQERVPGDGGDSSRHAGPVGQAVNAEPVRPGSSRGADGRVARLRPRLAVEGEDLGGGRTDGADGSAARALKQLMPSSGPHPGVGTVLRHRPRRAVPGLDLVYRARIARRGGTESQTGAGHVGSDEDVAGGGKSGPDPCRPVPRVRNGNEENAVEPAPTAMQNEVVVHDAARTCRRSRSTQRRSSGGSMSSRSTAGRWERRSRSCHRQPGRTWRSCRTRRRGSARSRRERRELSPWPRRIRSTAP